MPPAKLCLSVIGKFITAFRAAGRPPTGGTGVTTLNAPIKNTSARQRPAMSWQTHSRRRTSTSR